MGAKQPGFLLIVMRNVVIATFIWVVLSSVNGFSEKLFPDDLRCMPVLLEIPTTTNKTVFGTGVYLIHSNKLFLATAAHVLFGPGRSDKLIGTNANLTSCVRESLAERAVFNVDLIHFQNSGSLKRHREHDVAIIQLSNGEVQENNAGQRTWTAEGFLATNSKLPVPFSTEDACKKSLAVENGNDIYVLGYPGMLIPNGGEQIDHREPLVRRGIISQKNRATGKLIADLAVYGGNSGGPVVTLDHTSLVLNTFRLVGLVVEYVPAVIPIDEKQGVLANSGYSVVEPIDFVLELLDR